MSEEQLTALLAKLKDDAGLQEKLKGAADRDAAAAMMKEAGFGALLDVSKEDWLKYQANQTVELSDEDLGNVSGGFIAIWVAMGFVDGMTLNMLTGLASDQPHNQTAAEIAQKIGR
jgi:predicted ribosomally synthesized peptide with nif11-like leader